MAHRMEIIVAGTKTYVAKPGEIEHQWWVVDADEKIVGRLATQIAVVLMGKHRPTYTPHVDCGDLHGVSPVKMARSRPAGRLVGRSSQKVVNAS